MLRISKNEQNCFGHWILEFEIYCVARVKYPAACGVFIIEIPKKYPA